MMKRDSWLKKRGLNKTGYLLFVAVIGLCLVSAIVAWAASDLGGVVVQQIQANPPPPENRLIIYKSYGYGNVNIFSPCDPIVGAVPIDVDHHTVTWGIINPSWIDFCPGETVTLTATADPAWAFLHWEDGGDHVEGGVATVIGTANPLNLVMDINRSVRAVFVATGNILTITPDPITGIGATLDPPGGSYLNGVSVTVTASEPHPALSDPEKYYYFSQWSGDLSTTPNPESIIMDANKTLGPVYVPGKHIRTTLIGDGLVDMSASEVPDVGPVNTATGDLYVYHPDKNPVSISASGKLYNTQSRFQEFHITEIDGVPADLTQTDSPLQITTPAVPVSGAVVVSESIALETVFIATADLFVWPPVGSGSVQVSPAAQWGSESDPITGGQRHEFNAGTSVTITAIPDPGWLLSEWNQAVGVFRDDFDDGVFHESSAFGLWGVYPTPSWTAQNFYLQKTDTQDSMLSLNAFLLGIPPDFEEWFKYYQDGNASAGNGEFNLQLRYKFIIIEPLVFDTDTLRVHFTSAGAFLQERLGSESPWVDIASSPGTVIAPDTWYQFYVLCAGSHVEVWRGPIGGSLTKILETDVISVVEAASISFNPVNEKARIDDVEIIASRSVTSQNPITVTMDEDKVFEPTFIPGQDLLVLPPTGSGTVQVSPAAQWGMTIDPVTSGEIHTFDTGTAVTLTAVPTTGWGFYRWVDGQGVELDLNNPTALTMNADKTYRAVFSEMVTLADPALEVIIRTALNMPVGDILAVAATLTDLDASSAGITDLGGLEYFVNLQTLNLGINQIVDISALQGLTNLTYLNLVDNQVTNIQALLNNTGLGGGDTVVLVGNSVSATSLSALRALNVNLEAGYTCYCGPAS